MATVTIEQIQNSIQKGITFVPEVDLRKDMILGYGYTMDEVIAMQDDEVYAFFDELEYGEEEKEMYPISCKCGHHEMECTGYDDSAMISDHYMFECPKCKEVTHIHECAMDNIFEEMEFTNKLNDGWE